MLQNLSHLKTGTFIEDNPLPDTCKALNDHEFQPGQMEWKLKDVTRSRKLNFNIISDIVCPDLLHALKLVLVAELQSHFAPGTVAQYFDLFRDFIKHVNLRIPVIHSITSCAILNWKSHLGPNKELLLRFLSTFLRHWFALGYPGVEPATNFLLEEIGLRKHRTGEAVRTRHSKKGPFSNLEFSAIHIGLHNAFRRREISLREYVLVQLLLALGARSVQLAMLKCCDLIVKSLENGTQDYVLRVPRAKQLRGARRRSQFTNRPLVRDIAMIIKALIDEVQKDFPKQLSPLQDDPLKLPLFPKWHAAGLPGFEYHSDAADLQREVRCVFGRLCIVSERTGKPLNVSSYRFRYTIGTRAAEEGHSTYVIAAILDHSTTKSILHYTAATGQIIDRIDKATAFELAKLAQAFAGKIVPDESAAERGEDPRSRIADPRYKFATGTCGEYGPCHARAPIACYTCPKFQAWQNGPHEQVLEHLLKEREQLALRCDMRIASAYDNTIIALADLITRIRRTKANE